jgi:hypothetical protein
VVKLTVGSGADLVNHGRLKIEVDATRNVLASTSLCNARIGKRRQLHRKKQNTRWKKNHTAILRNYQ